jgi:glycine cleavage system H lipoate-binding protein
MLIPVYLPRFLEPGMIECDCLRDKINMEFKTAQLTWLKREGDYLKKDELICEAEVEKAVCEIFAPAEGYLMEICIKEGEYCGVKDVLCCIESPADQT